MTSDHQDFVTVPSPLVSNNWGILELEAESAAPATASEAEDDAATNPEDAYDAGDVNSGYGDSLVSSTKSLTASVIDYVYENGRRYHRFQAGKYMMPNDETEQDRLDIYHHFQFLSLRGLLYTAPLKGNPHNILDCGTGTGIWALDMGEMFPCAQVIGVDLSPIQPTWVFPNVKFEVDDLELEWTFKEDYFDLIHSRNIAQSIRNWPCYLRQMFRSTRPGGYVELAETEAQLHCDDGTYAGSNLERYMNNFWKAGTKAGLLAPDGNVLRQYAEEAGFVDVEIHYYKQPWGAWPKNAEMKKIGETCALAIGKGGFEAYAMALFTRYLDMSAEDVVALCRLAQADVGGKRVHTYQIMWHVTGMKPEDD